MLSECKSALVVVMVGAVAGCAGPVERVNYSGVDCRVEDGKSPVMEQVGGKTVALCVEKPVANLVACAKSVAVATDVNLVESKLSAGVTTPHGVGGQVTNEGKASSTVTYSEAAPLLAARAAGLNACRRAFERDSKLSADEIAVELGRSEQRVAIYGACMTGLEKLTQGESERVLRDTVARQCLEFLKGVRTP